MIKNLVSLSFSVIMLLAGCSVADSVVVTPTATLTPPPAATDTLPSPSDTPLPSLSPTDTSTPTPSQPVFNPAALGDSRMLASFIVTRNVKNTSSGGLSETRDTMRYIKEPLSVYMLVENSLDGAAYVDKYYLIGGWYYHENDSGDWYIFTEANRPDKREVDYLLGLANMRWGNWVQVESAQFVGQEDFQGIPANHFTFDQTDLKSYAYYSETKPAPDVEGDFYLAQDGNYVLYTHFKETDSVGVYEFTEELSSINQLTEIALPADFLPSNLELDLVLPLPAGTTLIRIKRYSHGLGVDYYTYMTSVRNNAEFLEFYKNLASTDGWTVSYIGMIENHEVCVSQDCVIIKKGDAQFILYYDGWISADWDKEHRFHPN